MTVVTLKFIHVATIAVWAAGLITMPFLFRQRHDIRTRSATHELHALARFLYVVILSPAAFVAIGTGAALIFVREVYDVWFSIKLLLVGLLVGVHIATGYVLLKLFDETGRYPSWRFHASTALTTLIVIAILVVVLAKPPIEAVEFAQGLFVPGALGERLEPFIRRWTP